MATAAAELRRRDQNHWYVHGLLARRRAIQFSRNKRFLQTAYTALRASEQHKHGHSSTVPGLRTA
jgi:hypothetical protein